MELLLDGSWHPCESDVLKVYLLVELAIGQYLAIKTLYGGHVQCQQVMHVGSAICLHALHVLPRRGSRR